MGFIKAITDSVGGTFADQWLDYYGPKSGVSATTALFPAVKISSNNQRGENDKGSNNIISNGSKIMVPEGFALITMQEGGVTGFIAESGSYTFASDDVNAQSFFGGDGIISSTIKQSWDRFKFGGQAASNHAAYYVNLKEIPNNRFGTKAQIQFFDNYLNAQVGLITRGAYSIKIVDPILFIKEFVPVKYLTAGSEDFDFADMNNDAGSQLFTEVVSSLGGAFSRYTQDASKENSIMKVQGDMVNFAKSLSFEVENGFGWKSQRGLEIVKVALEAIEYDEATQTLIEEVRKVDALSGARGNAYMQQSIARGLEAAGSNPEGGAMGMAFMNMGVNAAGNMMGGLNQPVQPQAPQAQVAEDPYAKLTEMKKLLDSGVITEADFNAAKAKILGI